MEKPMQKKGVIFSDVDGTLCFHQAVHGIRELERREDGTVLVEDPLSGSRHPAYDVSTDQAKGVYLGTETRQLALQLRERYDIVFVTGARPATIQVRKHVFDFADAIILESGAVIYGPDLEIDPVWAGRMEPEKASLAQVAEALRTLGWVMDNAGRTAALRIRRKDNSHRTDAEFEALRREFPLPATLKKTVNLDSLDIILRSAGKDLAVAYWCERHGYPASRSIGIGDDINDLEFLQQTGRPFMLASAYPEALQIARRNGWEISPAPHIDGINAILRTILDL